MFLPWTTLCCLLKQEETVGYAYQMKMYTDEDKWNENDTELGLWVSSPVVIKLFYVLDNINHKVYFDNYYKSLLLLHYFERNVYFVTRNC